MDIDEKITLEELIDEFRTGVADWDNNVSLNLVIIPNIINSELPPEIIEEAVTLLKVVVHHNNNQVDFKEWVLNHPGKTEADLEEIDLAYYAELEKEAAKLADKWEKSK